jgi:hypothetical protein
MSRALRARLARILLNPYRAHTRCLTSDQPAFRRITMHTLTIKDLARTEELDRGAMAAVRGGWKMGTPTYSFDDMKSHSPKSSPSPSSSSFDSSLHATQSLVQMQDVVNATANGSAFLEGIYVDNHVSQNGTNKISR